MKKNVQENANKEKDLLSRRFFLSNALAAGVLMTRIPPQNLSAPKRSSTVTVENFSAAGKSEGRVQVARVIKTDAEWRKQLSPDSYEVTRHADTERPFTGKNWNNHASGIYRCICCDTPLFDSQTKFESGTGWPSFWQPLSRSNIVESPDNSLRMQRIAVSCARCDAHLGHVFDDGPKPTGLRYCMNSVAMRFVARA